MAIPNHGGEYTKICRFYIKIMVLISLGDGLAKKHYVCFCDLVAELVSSQAKINGSSNASFAPCLR